MPQWGTRNGKEIFNAHHVRREKETPYCMQDEWDGNGNSNAKMGTKRDTKLERKEKLEQEGKNSMQKGNKRRHKNCVEKKVRNWEQETA